jgi:hypothetical protein
MKTRVLASFGLVLSLMVILTGCSGISLTDLHGDSQKAWVLKEYVLDGQEVPLPDYAKDDRIVFKSDGTGVCEFGALYKDQGSPMKDDPFTWTLDGDQLEIKGLESLHPPTGEALYTITKASPDEFAMERDYDEDGEAVKLQMVYVTAE